MSAKDIFHEAVKRGLEKEGWIITHDPLVVKFGKDKMSIDLGAEQILAAERGTEKIAVEIKSFLGDSELFDYHAALGQFLNYRLALRLREPERVLFLAVPLSTYRSLFSRDFAQSSVQEYQVKLIVYDPNDEVIVQWQS
ncbi:fatty-acid oxidation protein subunit alpha [Nostoc linckia z18]|uniref:Fatty-acid oxidation protein subunit alpha n=2 Tax=Nostoc linckia TaxID=92942 RepID=A0A9Q6EL64_NOSLI|nr:XisH family protein [Nostoc linckia]PHK40584.1 fatty-acid oxidation protein subunit alpha [Nostoc linckia z15]PHJ60714.1 fatty-acid oxidation protein subunit alpha [Nostoc linckia z1]PHJ62225.1 fatty-acid oxidation protein subunit alpha [Nostoc linckia z3]PHJ71475.1 fatty-acid oxidation protein subunit alpha [Nostoc linckia z2]PHJ80140.1 fatty-acid oxidation protein subunit alpha [Nostoc linckia z4]